MAQHLNLLLVASFVPSSDAKPIKTTCALTHVCPHVHTHACTLTCVRLSTFAVITRLSYQKEATSNKCHASSNKCLTSSNKKLLGPFVLCALPCSPAPQMCPHRTEGPALDRTGPRYLCMPDLFTSMLLWHKPLPALCLCVQSYVACGASWHFKKCMNPSRGIKTVAVCQ